MSPRALLPPALDVASVPRHERVRLLRAVPGLDAIADDVLEALAGELREITIEQGHLVVQEGDAADQVFLVVEGKLEISRMSWRGSLPVALLHSGDLFGELALIAPTGRRTATVTALQATRLLVLDAARFRALLAARPEAEADFRRHAERLLVAAFLHRVGPFKGFGDEQRQWLADRLRRLSIPAGSFILKQGESGQSCFLLREGKAEVFVEARGEERRLNVVGAGEVIGEAALLSGSPRTASVRALEPCELLELDRETLREVLRRDERVGQGLVGLMRLRERPRRIEGVIAVEQTTPEGDAITILKDPNRHAYYRLSAQGRFIWDRLDGTRSVRDLTLEAARELERFAPHAVGGVVAGLAAAGFVRLQRHAPEFQDGLEPPSGGKRLIQLARRLLHWRLELRGLDRPLTRAFRGGVRLLYTRAGKIVMAILALMGIVAFAALAAGAGNPVGGEQRALSALVVPGVVLMLLVHEAGHAFTVKAYGREVHRAGVGWYWFTPVFFVDTSDMWLSGRRERIVVSLAGPYAPLVLGGALGIAALLVSDNTAAAVLWTLMLPIYIGAVLNFNPLLEFDGYYVLADLLDRPNFRAEALGWLGSMLPTLLRHPARTRGHWLEISYGVASLLYVAVMALATVVVYRVLAEEWIAGALPDPLPAGLGWLLAALVAVAALAVAIGEMRGGPGSERCGAA